ncbi:hypothetical protein EJ05DRAFT_312091 [Pseudovirgaria hyperparasitica]|uniref:Uncharacterized protein n=1 Tax=Pseudovirgaria hyperparasitica TaxID=470096 RepID=A0A6A6WAG6_9PEZI|nr:uncharacterized protein EJ05DRAFT_312091 [Pseudovirgaria hyperparasitica]KAF2759852.1 hypothetical protein EJ05DRAFT_312091 [Pseudovirgaria hyperparasitica]
MMVHGRIARDKRLAALLKYTVKEKNENDKNRCKNFVQYGGTDDCTWNFLQSNVSSWNDNPASFWDGTSSPVSSTAAISLEVVLFHSYLGAKQDTA